MSQESRPVQAIESVQGLPLNKVVVCCTAIAPDVRTRLASYAIEMGAGHNLDLTAEVTHLIVGKVTTEKYRFVARQRPDVKVLLPEWIEKLRDQWLSGDEVDVAALEKQYTCPAFHGLQICATGFTHLEDRYQLEQTVRHHGADYSGDFTRQMTHLVVAAPQGPKYTAAKQWNIPCVSSRWLTDSMARGMALNESLYDPLTPEEEQGKNAYKTEIAPRTVVGKRRRGEDTKTHEDGKRKLRRTASTRLEEHSQDLWQDISAVDNEKEEAGADQWTNDAPQHTERPVSKAHPSQETVTNNERLFSGWRMCLQGFDVAKRKKLQHVLQEQCGACIVDSTPELNKDDAVARCILVPHNPPRSLYYLSSSTASMVIATEWWVERCIHSRTIIDTKADALSRPLWDLDLPSLSGMHISSTGLSSMDLRQVAAVVALLGATYDETLESSTSVLISGSNNTKKEKALYAKKYNIPIVTAEWLWSSIRLKQQDQFEPFHLAYPAGSLPGSSACQDVAVKGHQRRTARHPARDAGRPAAAVSAKPRSARAPIIHEDEDSAETEPMLQTKNSPLQDRSPNRPSPEKTSPGKKRAYPRADGLGHNENLAITEVKTPEELSIDIASLTRRLQRSRSGGNETGPERRKKRTLGRAASALSNRSNPISAEHSMEDKFALWADGKGLTNPETTPAVSTQLGYEVPEAEAHRVEMAKRMGTSFADEHAGTRLASLGTVKDAEGTTRSRRIRISRP